MRYHYLDTVLIRATGGAWLIPMAVKFFRAPGKRKYAAYTNLTPRQIRLYRRADRQYGRLINTLRKV